MSSTNPTTEPFSLEKIKAEMLIVSEKILEVANQPSTEEIWCQIGNMWYGHPVTPLKLRYSALEWLAKHPPDPRGEPMYSRPAPYKVRMETIDLMELYGVSERTAQRVLKMVREAIGRTGSTWVTVEEFCFHHKLDEDSIQKRLHENFLKRWNKIKRDKKIDEDDY
jgi:hypothetical protein